MVGVRPVMEPDWYRTEEVLKQTGRIGACSNSRPHRADRAAVLSPSAAAAASSWSVSGSVQPAELWLLSVPTKAERSQSAVSFTSP